MPHPAAGLVLFASRPESPDHGACAAEVRLEDASHAGRHVASIAAVRHGTRRLIVHLGHPATRRRRGVVVDRPNRARRTFVDSRSGLIV